MTKRSKVIGRMPKPEAEARSGGKPSVSSSVKPSHAEIHKLKDDLIRRTREVWNRATVAISATRTPGRSP